MTTFTRSLAAFLDDGHRTPCAGRSEWLSDNPSDRRQAAFACASCPLKTACHAEAVARRERFGVWGGRDLTAHPVDTCDYFADSEKAAIRHLAAGGLGYRLIARELNLSDHRVKTYISTLPADERRAPTRPTDPDTLSYEREAVEMRSVGLSYDVIAASLGITHRQARLAWYRHKKDAA